MASVDSENKNIEKSTIKSYIPFSSCVRRDRSFVAKVQPRVSITNFLSEPSVARNNENIFYLRFRDSTVPP